MRRFWGLLLLCTFSVAALPAATGNGLCVDYYSGYDFDVFYSSGGFANVDFDIPVGTAPGGAPATDPYSIRWHGKVQAPVTGTYTFCTNSDDGSRLWVNGVQLVNNWTVHAWTRDCGTVDLVAGQYYDIIVENMQNNAGQAGDHLLWTVPGFAEAIVPVTALFCSCLSIAKSVNTSVAAVGDTVTYSLVMQDCGTGASNGRIWDTLAANLVRVGGTPPSYSAPPYFRWDYPTVNPSQAFTVQVQARVASGSNGQVVHNVTDDTADTLIDNVSNDAIFTIYNPGTELTKAVNRATASPGDTLTYSIHYFDPAPAPITGFDLMVSDNASAWNTGSLPFSFDIYNYSGASVNTADFTVAFWIADQVAPAAITFNSYYSGGTAPWVGSPGGSLSMATTVLPVPILAPASEQATMEVDIRDATAFTLPNNTAWTGTGMSLSVNWTTPFQDLATYYSKDPGGSKVDDPHFALYYQGKLVKEVKAGGTADPLTGCPPGSLSITDVVPANLTYVGSNPPATLNAGTVTWNDTCFPGQGTKDVTWWAVVNAGTPNGTLIPNRANYENLKPIGLQPGLSQFVYTTITAGTASPTPSFTRTASPTATRTASPSATLTATRTVTLTQTPSITPSPTPSATRTQTPSVTASATLTATPSATLSATPTATRSATPTATLSSTPTATRSQTPSVTITFLDTFTHTRTATPTATITVTPSATRTATPSATQTVTLSATPTVTVTPTATPTFSATVTRSASPTSTPSFSDSPTQSPGPSPTDTATSTVTPSQTPTYSATATRSHTPTVTLTSSDTPTQSPGPSPTDTATCTVTPSQTATYTATSTRSSTPTVTDTPSCTSTESPGPSPTDTATVTSTPSQTPTSSATATRSDTPTLTDTPSVTPTATDSPQNTATATPSASPTWTATPSATPSATRSLTSTVTPTGTPSATQSATRTHTPSATVTPTATESFTASPSPTPVAPFKIGMRVYNSAGELVTVAAEGVPAWLAPTGFMALQSAFAPGQGARALFQALGSEVLMAWDGRNSSGQVVGPGAYTLVMDQIDSFGAITTFSASTQVLALPASLELDIYNSAGELVRHFTAPAGVAVTRLELSEPGFLPLSQGGKDLGIVLDSSSPPLVWDGRNDQGLLLAPGSYIIRVHSSDAKGDSELSREVVLLTAPGGDPFDGALAYPDPLGPDDPVLRIALPAAPAGLAVHAQVYSLSGERVADLDTVPGGLAWNVDASRSASGIYFIDLQAIDADGRPQRKVLKVAITR